MNLNDIQNVTDADQALISDTEQASASIISISYLITKLKNILQPVINAGKNMVAGKEFVGFTQTELDHIKKSIVQTLNEIDFTLKNGTKATLINGYKSGSTVANQLLRAKLDTVIENSSLDAKALKILVNDMFRDYSLALDSAKKMINKFFKLSGQSLLKDTGLTSSITKGLLDKGSLWGAKKQLMKDLLVQLNDGKFIPITCRRKYGSTYIANYRVDKYAELVTRTRYGQAQVIGAIQTAHDNGVMTFTVTSHNTQTAICKPHEGKIYTTDPELINLGIFPALDGATTPLYHPNCQHRLVPKVYSGAALERLKSMRGV